MDHNITSLWIHWPANIDWPSAGGHLNKISEYVVTVFLDGATDEEMPHFKVAHMLEQGSERGNEDVEAVEVELRIKGAHFGNVLHCQANAWGG